MVFRHFGENLVCFEYGKVSVFVDNLFGKFGGLFTTLGGLDSSFQSSSSNPRIRSWLLAVILIQVVSLRFCLPEGNGMAEGSGMEESPIPNYERELHHLLLSQPGVKDSTTDYPTTFSTPRVVTTHIISTTVSQYTYRDEITEKTTTFGETKDDMYGKVKDNEETTERMSPQGEQMDDYESSKALWGVIGILLIGIFVLAGLLAYQFRKRFNGYFSVARSDKENEEGSSVNVELTPIVREGVEDGIEIEYGEEEVAL